MSCSVIIPTKDRPRLLRTAVDSALKALPADGELLVVDDGRNLSAQNALTGINVCARRLRICQNERFPGCSGARNHGASVSKGKLLFFLDDDDVLHPDYIAAILHLVDEIPELEYGFCKVKVSDTGIAQFNLRKSNCQQKKLLGDKISKLAPKNRVFGLGQGFWIRSEVWKKMGGLDEDFVIGEDYDLAVRLLANRHVGWFCREPMVIVRQHHPSSDLNNITNRTSRISHISCWKKIYQKNQEFFQNERGLRIWLFSRIAKHRGIERDFSILKDIPSHSGKLYLLLKWFYYFTCATINRLKNLVSDFFKQQVP